MMINKDDMFDTHRNMDDDSDVYMSTMSIDLVNSPPHYNQHGVECIDAIQAATSEGFQYYLQGNILKYLWRYRYKNGSQDLEKARWYLDKLIEVYEDEG